MKVITNRDKVLYYDTHDSSEIDNEILRNVDFYFKRSYSDEEVNKLVDKEKVFPLGLNYAVYISGLDVFLLRRVALDRGIEKLKSLAKGIGLDYLLKGILYIPRVDRLGLYPDFDLPPRVLFMVKAYNPSSLKSPRGESINHTRARCIRLLKKEFGEHFFGGFVHDDYSRRTFGDCLLPDNSLSAKNNYMNILKEFPICVATAGLWGSIGWKLGEHVAYARVIVTERLNYRVPGDFRNGLNYLDFFAPEGCVESAVRLFQDHQLRSQLMMNNYRYYQAYLRPDSLVLNTLAITMQCRPEEAMMFSMEWRSMDISSTH